MGKDKNEEQEQKEHEQDQGQWISKIWSNGIMIPNKRKKPDREKEEKLERGLRAKHGSEDRETFLN